MKISYDEDVDAMYIQLIEGDHQCRTIRLNDDVSLDLDERERLVGIEILDAKRVLGKGKLPRVLVDSLAMGVPKRRPRAAHATSRAAGRLRKAS